MKKVFYAALLMLALALLMGGSCGPKEEVPLDTTPTTGTDTPTTQEEPKIDTGPEIQPLQSGDFQKVYFDFDKYNIRSDARAALETNAGLLKQHANARITIEGHCDERGTVEYNLALGERRARACKDYLVSLGIEGGRLNTQTYGKERPVALGHDEASWQLNRRAEFKVEK